MIFFITIHHVPFPSSLITTNFKQGHARSAFPCFDDPKYKATFAVTVEHLYTYEAIGSTIVSKTTVERQTIVTKFNKIPLQINADIVSFSLVERLEKSSLPLLTGIDIYHTQFLNVTVTLRTLLLIQTAHTTVFGKSAVTHNNFIAAPFRPKQGRIDNWGIHFVDEDVMLRPLLKSTPEKYQETLQMYSNQFSLNWLEFEVTPDTWEEWWISRGLGKFYEYYAPSNNLVSKLIFM